MEVFLPSALLPSAHGFPPGASRRKSEVSQESRPSPAAVSDTLEGRRSWLKRKEDMVCKVSAILIVLTMFYRSLVGVILIVLKLFNSLVMIRLFMWFTASEASPHWVRDKA